MNEAEAINIIRNLWLKLNVTKERKRERGKERRKRWAELGMCVCNVIGGGRPQFGHALNACFYYNLILLNNFGFYLWVSGVGACFRFAEPKITILFEN